MADFFAHARDVCQEVRKVFRPPPKLTLSEWADTYYFLSAESAAEPGRWKTIPYQKGFMDAITDPRVTWVIMMKSARIGYTKCIDAAIGYGIHQDPCPMLVVQPTVEDAKGFSKEEIAPMIRDCPVLSQIVFEDASDAGPRDSGNTILHKKFPGGVLSMVGANSGAGFRRISRKRVFFDEVDGYPPSAGSDGDPIKLGARRAEYYHDRKLVSGSTPLIAGHSRIETMFLEGDQRRYYVPCPQCDHMDHLVFTEKPSGGHFMKWPKDEPEKAYFVCSKNGCIIEHKDKYKMVERGEWRASQPFNGKASFHIWTAYSYSPNASWAEIAKEFIAAKKDGPEALKTFVNTVLGETWKDKGEAPDWERLYNRRETYTIGTVPDRVTFLTAGLDVQKDRTVYEVVGWNERKESWSIEAGVINMDPSIESDWRKVDELLSKTWRNAAETPFSIRMLAADSGYNTQVVYNWVRRYPMSRVIAVKGSQKARHIIGLPSQVDIKMNGKRVARGFKVFMVGVDIAKSELYGWLRLPKPKETETFPVGFCHFPEYDEEYFKQITSEHLVTAVTRQGYTKLEWQLLPGRENHWLDCRVYARAAAVLLGLDRIRLPDEPAPAPHVVETPVRELHGDPSAPRPIPKVKPTTSGFLGGGNRGGVRGKKGWLR